MPWFDFIPLNIVIGSVLVWIALGVAGLALMRAPRFITGFVFPAGALVSLALAAAGLWAIGAPPTTAILPAGLPDLPFHVRIDALSGFFLLLLGGVSFGISLFACGYFRDTEATALGLLSLQYHVFLASMAFVLIADDAYLFMLTWESMALSSYFLVTTEHHNEQNRKAGFIYLLVAHIGALGILLCFGVLHGGHGDYTFETLRQANLNGFWATLAFLLAFFGVGAKAGMLPLHVWLPEAHPAAPSPGSALVSWAML